MARKDARSGKCKQSFWKARLGWVIGGAALIGACLAIRSYNEPDSASAQGPLAARGTPSHQAKAPRRLEVMAIVNRTEIGRQTLADACLKRFGSGVLESLVNKQLIAIHCKKHKITLSDAEVNAEIDRLADKFNLGTEQYLKLLEKERGIGREEYARDILWPTLALRKLAAHRLTVSEQDLQEAYEANFGAAVKARLLSVETIEKARHLHAQLKQRPEEFPRLAGEHSTDVGSASLGGLLQPIRQHVGDKQIEKVAFEMREGEVSPIIRVGGQFVILKCEGRLSPRNVPLEQVRPQLEEKIKQRKLRKVAGDVFQKLQAGAQVVNVWNDPALQQKMPGIAATINGHNIFVRDLAEEALARHGDEVLDGLINRALLKQAIERNKVEVTQADIDAEIAHAAVLAGVVTQGETPDVPRWIEMVTKRQGISYELYLEDVVWPSTALKKLSQDTIEVVESDLEKGFEANYGPRVRCRAIVLSKLRRAQEVWDKARRYEGEELIDFFGELAEQYSEEASSRSLRGEVPPIRKSGGQPVLEREAFKLQPGQISGVIQAGDRFVILYCEGYTEAMNVQLEEVEGLLHRDIYEKKLRIAMASRFESIRRSAKIDNYLAGTSHTPARATSDRTTSAPRR